MSSCRAGVAPCPPDERCSAKRGIASWLAAGYRRAFDPLEKGWHGARLLANPSRYIEHAIKEAPNLHRPFLLHMAMADKWVQPEVNAFVERKTGGNPLVTIEKYPGAPHAFARRGGIPYSKPEADRALGISIEFFRRHLG